MEPQPEDTLKIQTICDLGALQSLREFWRSRQAARDCDFDFFSARVRSRGNGCRPHIIVLSRNGQPDALLIGLRDRAKLPLRLCSFIILEPEVNTLEFVYGGLLGNASSENCATLIRTVMRSLAEGEADVALWEHLDVRSPLYTCATRLPKSVLRDHSPYLQDHWFMNFPKTLDAFVSGLGRSQRSKLRRKYNRVVNGLAGRMQVRCYRTVADLEQAIPEMEKISRKSFKRRLGYGFFDAPQAREQLVAEAAQGWLRIYILYIEEQPISFWKGTLYDCCLQADHVGFDLAWGDFSPGIVLFLYILKNLHHEDIKTVDLGCGEGQFYECFGGERRPEACVQIYAPKISGLRLNALHTLFHNSTVLVRRLSTFKGARKAVWRRKHAALGF
jgi:Acetyltransferase (GNAT) domain